MDGFALELFDFRGAGVGEHQVADVNVGPHARMAALVHETRHAGHAVQEAQTERLQFQRDVNAAFVRVIAQAAADFQPPIPLRLRRDDFALPNIFPQNDQDIFRAPGAGQVHVLAAAGEVELAHRLVEINQSHRHHRQGNNGQAEPGRHAADQADFAFGDARRLGENIHAIKADAGNVFQSRRRRDAGLLKGAVDDAKLHGEN